MAHNRHRYFPTKDELWLRNKLDERLEESASGTLMTSWSEGDTSAASQLLNHADETIRRLCWDLSILNPEEFPADMVNPRRRTKPNFSGLNSL